MPPWPPAWCTHREEMGCFRNFGSACCFCSDPRLTTPLFNHGPGPQLSQEQNHALDSAYCNSCQEFRRGLQFTPTPSASFHLTRSLFGPPARQPARHTRSSSARSLGATPSRVQRANQPPRSAHRREHAQSASFRAPPAPRSLVPPNPLAQNPPNMPPGPYPRPGGAFDPFHPASRAQSSNAGPAEETGASNTLPFTNLDQMQQRQAEQGNSANDSTVTGGEGAQSAFNAATMNDTHHNVDSSRVDSSWQSQTEDMLRTPAEGSPHYRLHPFLGNNNSNIPSTPGAQAASQAPPHSEGPSVPYFQANWDNLTRDEFQRTRSAVNRIQNQFGGHFNMGAFGSPSTRTHRTRDHSYQNGSVMYYPHADGTLHSVTPDHAPRGMPTTISTGPDGQLVVVRYDENGQPAATTNPNGPPSAPPGLAPEPQHQPPARDPRRFAYIQGRRPSPASAGDTINQYDDFYARHVEHAQLLMAEARRAALAENDDTPKGLDDANDERPPPKESEELTINMECKVCMTQLIDTVVLPCGHAVLCRWCADQHMLKNRTGRPRPGVPCPICRKPVKQKVRMFLA